MIGAPGVAYRIKAAAVTKDSVSEDIRVSEAIQGSGFIVYGKACIKL